jgi:KUP system potassium uptake protein
VKRILRYIVGTASLGLTYRKSVDGQQTNKLNASADADHAGADDRRSVSGWCVMLNGAMISWASKRQPVTAISSTESEFYSVSQCAVECVYLRRLMEQIGYAQGSPTPIAQDNMACIYLTQGARMYHKAKHIDTRVYKVRELSSGDNPEVKLWKIDGSEQPSDIFTKALPRATFERHRSTIMGTAI